MFDGGQPGRGGEGGGRGGGYATGGPRSSDGRESAPPGLEELLELVRQDAEKLREGLEEVRLFARTNAADLERANQLKSQTAARIKEMEARLETFARQEIRQAYLNANEAEMHVFMMNEQRERMADKQRTYEKYLRAYQQIIATLTSLLEERQHGQEKGTGPLGALTRLVETQEQVRRRIAQRLHDGPAQALANVVLSAEICATAIDHDLNHARSELESLKSAVNATLQETRKFIFDLRPMTLDDLGLIPTLRRYAFDISNRSGVEIAFNVQGPEQRLPPVIEVSLFRIAQEALTNVAQHSRASYAGLTLAIEEQQLLMTIEDNGVGFDVEVALSESTARSAFGLRNMYERAEILGGQLVVESLSGRGTKVEFLLQRVRGESRSAR
jgi:two-component system sensor histidine kinase DegS